MNDMPRRDGTGPNGRGCCLKGQNNGQGKDKFRQGYCHGFSRKENMSNISTNHQEK